MTCKISTKRYAYAAFTDEVKSDKWKNLFFTKDGKSYLDVIIFPDIKTAQADVDKLKFPDLTGTIHAEDLSWGFSAATFSHAIQLPVK